MRRQANVELVQGFYENILKASALGYLELFRRFGGWLKKQDPKFIIPTAISLLALLIALGAHTRAVGGAFVPIVPSTFHAQKTLSEPNLSPQAQVASVYIAPPVVRAAPVAVTGCGGDSLMAYIYQAESGCRTNAINPGGCEGLGQECGHKYDASFPYTCSLYDWGCQDAWFRNYAVRAYGSIYSAYLFRTSHNYW